MEVILQGLNVYFSARMHAHGQKVLQVWLIGMTSQVFFCRVGPGAYTMCIPPDQAVLMRATTTDRQPITLPFAHVCGV